MQNVQNDISLHQAPLVSFIVPVYNLDTALVRECIESILALTLRPHEREIIVVDDGSDVCLLDELGQQKDSVIYVRQSNKGVSEARNTGLRMATGRFIQFVDGDDFLHTAMYEHCLDYARYDKADMVMFQFNSSEKPVVTYEDSNPESGTDFMRHNNLHGSACGYIFSRSLLGDLRFTPQVRYGEDEEFTAQLTLRAERVVTTTAVAYHYRKRQSSAIHVSVSHSPSTRLDDMHNVILRLNTTADRLPHDQRLALQRRVHQLTMDYVYNVLRLEKSRDEQSRRIDELRQTGLFPLPDRDYTTKYKWFRRLSASDFGMKLLRTIIPLTNER